MNKSVKYMALGLVILGVFLAWMAFMMSEKKSSSPAALSQAPVASQTTPMQRAVVANKAIAAGHFLAADDLQVKEVAHAPNGAFTDAAALLGRGIAQPLAEGDTITSSNLLDGVSGLLQPGERAVAIKVDESNAVGHKVQPGDWVDVLVVLRKDGQEVTSTQARSLLERKRVLAYGAQLEPTRALAPPKENDKGGIGSKSDAAAEQMRANNPARTAVLAVQVSEVNPLVLAERQGQIMLALRSPLEPVAALPTLSQATAGPTPAVLPDAFTLQNVVTLEHLAAHAGSKSPSKQPALELVRPMPLSVPQRTVDKPRPSPIGTAVEFIRGTRSETVHY